jgi:hypothetical protein
LSIEWWDGGLFGDGLLFGLYVVPFRISFMRARVPMVRVTAQGWLAAGLTRDFVWVFLLRRGSFFLVSVLLAPVWGVVGLAVEACLLTGRVYFGSMVVVFAQSV